jgi:transposase
MAPRTGHEARLELRLTDAQRKLLNTWARAGTTPQRVARRANAVLLAADGLSAHSIAKRLRISPQTAALWPRRYVQGGHEALWRDAPGRGRRPSIDPDAVSRVRTLVKTPAPDGGRWSIRGLAKATGLSRATVHRIARGNWSSANGDE